ncbi:MAG: signal peptide peptidase SppA [Dehalococcoidia bacterium]|nr:signal peptide peptidase SppA [Dehalococcoidia bacterium]
MTTPSDPSTPPTARPPAARRQRSNAGCWWSVGVLIGLATLLGACGVGVVIGAASGDGRIAGSPFGPSPAVAVIEVSGPIVPGGENEEPSLFGDTGSASSGRIVRLLRRAEQDPSVKAIVLRIDSPGGGVTASDEIYNQIVKTKAAGKKIVASFGTVAASGGYYIAAPADRIVANPTSLTGSIGVISVLPNVAGLLEKIGVQTDVFVSGPLKDAGQGFRPLTDTDRRVFQGLVDDYYARFVQVVAQGRGLDEATVRRLGDGRVYSGRQAQQARLVDDLGDLPEAIDIAARLAGIEGRPRVITYRTPSLFGGAGAQGLLRLPWLTATDSLGLDTRSPIQYRFIP